MQHYQLTVGEWMLNAEIDDPDRTDWRGTVAESPNICEGDSDVAILGQNGHIVSRSRARIVPGGPYQPTVLEGLEPFH